MYLSLGKVAVEKPNFIKMWERNKKAGLRDKIYFSILVFNTFMAIKKRLKRLNKIISAISNLKYNVRLLNKA